MYVVMGIDVIIMHSSFHVLDEESVLQPMTYITELAIFCVG